MPKATPAHRSLSGDSGSGSSGNQPNVLKRNQACHQCRRRKLKCDAKRPCSTCVRSHAHAVSHASPGTELPAHPECTFDDVAEPSAAVTDAPKSKYERLENRISELEELLRQKDLASPSDTHSSQTPEIGLPLSRASLTVNHHAPPGSSSSSPFSGSSDPSQGSIFPVSPRSTSAPHTDVMWSNWPQNLPQIELMRHLAEVFFTFHPHANRLFHGPTFLNSLASLPPGHPKFPAAPVLHAICAIGSLYTAAVTSPPLPDFNEMAPDEIFLEKQRMTENRVDSFAEQQAKFAKELTDTYTAIGKELFQVLQANIVLSWFYWSHSRWADVFLHSALSLRLSIPLGLNMCPPFHSISKSERPLAILTPARTVIDDEIRRNAFWLAYATERLHGASNGWASSLDDHDISQLLPLRGDQFESGILVTPEHRQWAHSPDLILSHPHEQVDSFILYIKGTILLSWVKSFNLRFRARHYAGDAAVASQPSTSDNVEPIDPRASPAFVQIEQTITQFRSTFPAHLKHPINSNVVDNHLYSTCLMPHVAVIILHEPHADVQQSGCISALKILTAARAILDLIFAASATSFDISLLDSFCSFAWFVGGRVLVRFLKAALETNSVEQVSTLQSELSFVRSGISKIGSRIPLAYRYAKLLEDHITQQTGSLPDQNLPLPMVELGTYASGHSFIQSNAPFSRPYLDHSLLP